MIDTHAHINSSRFKKDRAQVVAEAREAGVEAIIVPGTDLKDSRVAVECAQTYEGVYAAVGIHPSDATGEIDWGALEELLDQPKVVAVGEIGLDAYHTGAVTEAQIEVFGRQLQMALEHRKPVIIHTREATDETLKVLLEHWDAYFSGNIVFHCCEADQRLLDFAKERHLYIGIDGDITYDLAKRDFISQVPLEMLLLETDSPYLLPEPLRSEKKYPNTPANLVLVAKAVAETKGASLEDIVKVSTENARRLFKIPTPQS